MRRRRAPSTRQGRKAKCTPEIIARICNVVRNGHYLKVAAVQAGITERTLHRWIERSDPEHPDHRAIYIEFATQLERAEAESELVLVEEVKKGGPKYHLEVLKRRFPERWGDRHRTELVGPEGGSIPVEHSGNAASPVQVVIQAGDEWSADDEAAQGEETVAQEAAPGLEMPSDTDLSAGELP